MGGSGRARGAGLARRAVFTNKGRARGLLAEPPARSSHLPVQGPGVALGAPLADVGRTVLFVRRSAGLGFAEATPRWGPGPGLPGSGFWLRGSVEARERGKAERGEGGQARQEDLNPGWRDCRCSSGQGEGRATLSATRCSEVRGLLLTARRSPLHPIPPGSASCRA